MKIISENGEEMNKFLIEIHGKKDPAEMIRSMSNYFTCLDVQGLMTLLK